MSVSSRTLSMAVLLSSPTLETERYGARLARDDADLRAAQRLRFQVFNLELHEGLVSSHLTGLDADEFDPVCDHILVYERHSGQVVGTYRMQSGLSASRNIGYYSAQEFDFTPFEASRASILELGRACVAAEHRNTAVLSLLWRAIIRHACDHGLRYLIGCSSISSQDEAGAMVTYMGLKGRYLATPEWRTRPMPDCRCRPAAAEPLAVPRLMVSYLTSGARICGEPAIDRGFGTIDFLTLMDLENVPARFARKYLA